MAGRDSKTMAVRVSENMKNRFESVRKRRIWGKTGGICAHCGARATGINMTIDHYIPRSVGGGYDENNLVPLCRRCNRERMDKMVKAAEYYIYAPLWVIEACEEYERRWRVCHHPMLV
ncbi:MAG: HNH endonuclease [Lachnospiraceae bacterium]|nr:HNH endonuclease [Lachnospiraceae bacterium]